MPNAGGGNSTSYSAAESTGELPRYAAMLAAYHEAQRPSLRRMLNHLRLDRLDRVLDVPCGDGFYAELLAGRCGQLVGADVSGPFLARAKRRLKDTPAANRSLFLFADIYALPFEAGSFDFAWCAQSMISLREPRSALREIRRVLRPGGRLAVFEHDPLHHVLLPWPAVLEAAVQQAIVREAAAREDLDLFAGRKLRRWLRGAGFYRLRPHTFAVDHPSPLGSAARRYIDFYLHGLREDIRCFLPDGLLEPFDQLTSPGSPDYMPATEGFTMTCIDVITMGHPEEA